MKTPKSFKILITGRGSGMTTGMGSMMSGGSSGGIGLSKDLVELAKALKRQSLLSCYAAFCAGVSAMFQAASMFIK